MLFEDNLTFFKKIIAVYWKLSQIIFIPATILLNIGFFGAAFSPRWNQGKSAMVFVMVWNLINYLFMLGYQKYNGEINQSKLQKIYRFLLIAWPVAIIIWAKIYFALYPIKQ